ncbi:MAG TPA: hypothetical protein PLV25_08120, partial [Opitutales bacterium]|nr:hypothetical protein [Opitutales bacterium]
TEESLLTIPPEERESALLNVTARYLNRPESSEPSTVDDKRGLLIQLGQSLQANPTEAQKKLNLLGLLHTHIKETELVEFIVRGTAVRLPADKMQLRDLISANSNKRREFLSQLPKPAQRPQQAATTQQTYVPLHINQRTPPKPIESVETIKEDLLKGIKANDDTEFDFELYHYPSFASALKQVLDGTEANDKPAVLDWAAKKFSPHLKSINRADTQQVLQNLSRDGMPDLAEAVRALLNADPNMTLKY